MVVELQESASKGSHPPLPCCFPQHLSWLDEAHHVGEGRFLRPPLLLLIRTCPQICLRRTFSQVSGHPDQTVIKQTVTALEAQNISTMVPISQVEKPEVWKKGLLASRPIPSPAPRALTFLKLSSPSNPLRVLSGKCLTFCSPHLLSFQVRIILKQPPGHLFPPQPLYKYVEDLMNEVHP